MDCAGRDAIGLCAANQNPVLPEDEIKHTGGGGDIFIKGGGATHTSGPLRDFIHNGAGLKVTVPADFQGKIASKSNKISNIITHFNGGSEFQENKKHLVNFTTPTTRKLRQYHDTRTLLRKFKNNSTPPQR